MAANEDVKTTRLTDGACAAITLSIDVVPLIAGSRTSSIGLVKVVVKGEAVWRTEWKGLYVLKTCARN